MNDRPRMSKSSNAQAEVDVGGHWSSIGIAEALLATQTLRFRCPDCHGAMTTFKGIKGQRRPFFKHFRFHIGCPRSDLFSGVESCHPDAVV